MDIEITKKIAIFDHECRLTPPLLRTLANIRINQILPETILESLALTVWVYPYYFLRNCFWNASNKILDVYLHENRI